MNDVDLREAFESAFGDEPPLRPVDTAVDAGRAAVRRRHALAGGAGVLAASAVLLGAVQLGGTPETDPGFAASPSPTPTVSEQQRLTDATRVDTTWRSACGHPGQPTCTAYAEDRAPVWLTAGAELVRGSEEIQVLGVVPDRLAPATRRVVVEAITPPSIHPAWWVLTRTATGVRVQAADPGHSRIDFHTFAQAVLHGRPVPGEPSLARARALFDD